MDLLDKLLKDIPAVAEADAAIGIVRKRVADRPLPQNAFAARQGLVNVVLNAINAETGRLVAMETAADRSDLLALQDARYNYLLSKIWPQVEFGDLPSVEMARKLIGDLTKLHHLDAVDTATQTTQVLVIGGAEAEYVDALKKMVEG